MEASNTTLSLIICTRNRAAALRQCLDALDTQELTDVSGEVILVDNGSTDETPGVMHEFEEVARCPVTLVREEKPGLGCARNAGIAEARGEMLVFTDDDCYLKPGYFHVVRTLFADGKFHLCGGRILLYDPTDAPLGCNQQETFELIPPGSFIPAGKFQGANLVVHRRVIETVGPFDPSLGAGTPFRCEDIEFCARASLGGFAGAHVPELVVYHHHCRKTGADIRQHRKKNDFARGAYYAKLAMMGDFKFLRFWVAKAWKRQRMTFKNPRASLGMLSLTTREVRGALSFSIQTLNAAKATRNRRAQANSCLPISNR